MCGNLNLEPGSYISIIGRNSSDSEFWNEVKAGAERAAEDLNAALGYKGEDKVKVELQRTESKARILMNRLIF